MYRQLRVSLCAREGVSGVFSSVREFLNITFLYYKARISRLLLKLVFYLLRKLFEIADPMSRLLRLARQIASLVPI